MSRSTPRCEGGCLEESWGGGWPGPMEMVRQTFETAERYCLWVVEKKCEWWREVQSCRRRRRRRGHHRSPFFTSPSSLPCSLPPRLLLLLLLLLLQLLLLCRAPSCHCTCRSRSGPISANIEVHRRRVAECPHSALQNTTMRYMSLVIARARPSSNRPAGLLTSYEK